MQAHLLANTPASLKFYLVYRVIFQIMQKKFANLAVASRLGWYTDWSMKVERLSTRLTSFSTRGRKAMATSD